MADKIDIRDLTTGEHKGSGIYDELMRTSKSHIASEYKDGRIIGDAYGQVYLGMLQANLQAGLNMTLEMPLRNKQLDILDEQIKQAVTQTEMLTLQKEQLRIANEKAQYELDEMLPLQKEQLIKQNLLLDEQVKLAVKQQAQVDAQVSLVGKQEDLVDNQILSERDKTQDPTGGTNKAAYDKTQKEIELLNQKLITEKYQSTDTVDGIAASGLVGKEILLKNNQAESFLRNSELQVSKIYADIFSVMYSTEAEGMDNQLWGFGSDESYQVLKKLSEGIGIDVSGFTPTN